MMPNQRVGGRNVESYQRYTPQQMELFKRQFGLLGPNSYLARLAEGDPELMQEMERSNLREFTGTIGNIASRFSGQGTGGRHSSGFQLATGSAARDLQERLAAQRGQMQQQAIESLMGLSSQLLGQDPYEHFLVEPKNKSSWWKKALGGAAPAVGSAIGGYFGGAPGASLGGNLGSAFGSAFQ